MTRVGSQRHKKSCSLFVFRLYEAVNNLYGTKQLMCSAIVLIG